MAGEVEMICVMLLHFEDRGLGFEVVNGPSDSADQGTRLVLRANNQAEIWRRVLFVAAVHDRCRRSVQTVHIFISHHADDLDVVRLIRVGEIDTLADRVLMRKNHLRHGLVDDYHVGRFVLVLRIEEAPGAQRNAHDGKVVLRNRGSIGFVFLAAAALGMPFQVETGSIALPDMGTVVTAAAS